MDDSAPMRGTGARWSSPWLLAGHAVLVAILAVAEVGSLRAREITHLALGGGWLVCFGGVMVLGWRRAGRGAGRNQPLSGWGALLILVGMMFLTAGFPSTAEKPDGADHVFQAAGAAMISLWLMWLFVPARHRVADGIEEVFE